MTQLSGAGKCFGHKLLFENADWLITSHDVGLVGGGLRAVVSGYNPDIKPTDFLTCPLNLDKSR